MLNQRVFYALEDGRTAFRVQLVLTGWPPWSTSGPARGALARCRSPPPGWSSAISPAPRSGPGWSGAGSGCLGGRAIFRTLARILHRKPARRAHRLAGHARRGPLVARHPAGQPPRRRGRGLFFSAAYLLLVYVLQIRPVLDILAPFARRLPVLRSL